MPKPKSPVAITPDKGKKTAPAAGPSYGELIYGDTTIDGQTKDSILALADKARKSGSADDVKAFHESLFVEGGIGTGLPHDTRVKLSEMVTYGPQKTAKGAGAGKAGRRLGGGGGGGTGGVAGVPAPPPGSTGMPTQESAEASDKWSTDVTTGAFETNPWLQAMMDPARLDVRNNPNLQPVVDSVQREAGQDLLRSLWDKDAQAESKGRAGSGYSAALRVAESEQQNEAVADAISRIYAGAYENEANRQSGLMPSVLSTQASAARVPIEWDQNEINRQKSYWDYLINKGQLGVARGQLGLAKSQAGFERKMALQEAQQNALNSYVDILRGIGGLGGTTVETTPGVYSPSMDPWTAALMGAGGGWMESYGQKGQVQA